MVEIGKRYPRLPVRRLKRYHTLHGFLAIVAFAVICLSNSVRLFLKTSGSRRVSCRYHGNCPTGTVCEDDVCLPYDSGTRNATSSKRFDTCITACLAELKADERYLYGSVPVLQSTRSAWNGHGCVLHYKREQTKFKKGERPSFEEYIQGRHRRVVRVDPVDDGTSWVALCDDPCEKDSDCREGATCIGRTESKVSPGIQVPPKSCRPSKLTTEKALTHDMVIVTGSNSAYFHGLKNFAASAKFWAPDRKLVVYNLGMTAEQLATAKSWSNLYELHWEDGIPESYPPHVHRLKTYAWKPIIINETVHRYKSMLWLDAGATFVGPVAPIEEIIHRHGIFLVRGQDDHMKYRSHPGTYTWFGYNKTTFRAKDHFAGGIQGHVYPSRYIDSIVVPNAKCALDPNCIDPPGSKFENHRYDQTSLSILAYQQHVQAPSYTEYLAASRFQLNDDMREATQYIMWTARGTCNFYALLNAGR